MTNSVLGPFAGAGILTPAQVYPVTAGASRHGIHGSFRASSQARTRRRSSARTLQRLNGDPGHALEMAWGAIELAQDDIVLPFVAAHDAFAPLLARRPALAARWPRPADSGPVNVVVPAPRGAAGLPDPLTEREQAVLRFLATSLSPGEIADRMCLSVNTVKTHLAAIYRKLSASRRREAVTRARELELL
jgi:LuxR family transcriptional regulator, maltose regulon positive regulatory protein